AKVRFVMDEQFMSHPPKHSIVPTSPRITVMMTQLWTVHSAAISLFMNKLARCPGLACTAALSWLSQILLAAELMPTITQAYNLGTTQLVFCWCARRAASYGRSMAKRPTLLILAYWLAHRKLLQY